MTKKKDAHYDVPVNPIHDRRQVCMRIPHSLNMFFWSVALYFFVKTFFMLWYGGDVNFSSLELPLTCGEY
jgi:hypothetical protein